MDSKLIERALAVTPVLAHLNEKVQEDVTAQELLDISASGASDLFQSRTCSSNNNCSMRRPFYVDQTMDSRDVFGIISSLGYNSGDSGRCSNTFFNNSSTASPVRADTGITSVKSRSLVYRAIKGRSADLSRNASTLLSRRNARAGTRLSISSTY